MSLNKTSRGNRLHIGVFGRTNSGKSSFVNAFAGHNVSLVSEVAGTTTDVVYKSMEIHPVGPIVLMDTAGFDDKSMLGKEREDRTKRIIDKTDVAIVIFDGYDFQVEKQWIEAISKKDIPILYLISKMDLSDRKELIAEVKREFGEDAFTFDVSNIERDRKNIIDEIANLVPEDFQRKNILGNLIDEGEIALLIMPQDIQAPKGRLILPQVQTIRELLDRKCIAISVTLDNMESALKALHKAPSLVITDSQCFKIVKDKLPKESALTSFSVLFAAFKGDISALIDGAREIDKLNENSKVLIAEACTHAPLEEDIGRVKIPAMLRRKLGEGLQVDIVSGSDWKASLDSYDLIIHCGGCMFNRKHMMSRIADARNQKVPITNYGITIAKLAGILDEVVY